MSEATNVGKDAVLNGLIEAAELICRGETESFDLNALEIQDAIDSVLIHDIAASLEDSFVHMPGTFFKNRIDLKKWHESDLRWNSEVDLAALRAIKQGVPEAVVQTMRDAARAADFRAESSPARFFKTSDAQ